MRGQSRVNPTLAEGEGRRAPIACSRRASKKRVNALVERGQPSPSRAGVSHMEFSSPIRGLRLRTAVAPDGSDRIGSRTKQNRNANDGFQARTPLRAKESRALVRFPYAIPLPRRGRVARRALARRAGWGEPTRESPAVHPGRAYSRGGVRGRGRLLPVAGINSRSNSPG